MWPHDATLYAIQCFHPNIEESGLGDNAGADENYRLARDGDIARHAREPNGPARSIWGVTDNISVFYTINMTGV